MRLVSALILAACIAPAFAGDAPPAGAPAPNGDRAQIRELEMKMRALREQAAKDDPAIAKLKAEADDARKHFETAVEQKLKDNADYQALKTQADELRAKQQKPKEGKKDGDAPKAEAAKP